MSPLDRSVKVAKHVIDTHILYGRECGCGEPCATDDAFTAHLADVVLADAQPQLIIERDKAREAIAAVLAIHYERHSQYRGSPSWCASCGGSWPCPTARAAMGLL